MKLWKYYLLSWASGLLTLMFSVGGALAFVTYISSILYLCVSLFCIFRKLRAEEHRVLHFLLNLILYLATAAGTVPLLILLFN